MNNYSILLSVSETLKSLFSKPPPEINLEPSSIIFDSPADIKEDNTSKLLIYLYKTSENADLINAPVDIDRPMNAKVWIPRKPPQPIDLHYLIVPYGHDRAAEIIMIEWVLDTFYDNSIIDPKNYQGALNGSDNNGIKIIQTPLSMDELNKLWSLFSHKEFKLSLSYMVTPIFLPTTKTYEAHRVIQTELTVEEMAR